MVTCNLQQQNQKGNPMRNHQSEFFLDQYNNCFFEATMINKSRPYKNASNLRYSLDLPPKESKVEINNYTNEYESFKDDKLRVYRQNTPQVKVLKPGISLFRRQKRSKWLELLEEQPQSDFPKQKQNDAIIQQKISPLPVKVGRDNERRLSSGHRSVSYRAKGQDREIYTSLQKRSTNFKQKTRAASTLKLQANNAIDREAILSRDHVKTKKEQGKQINFCLQTKPISQRMTTALTKRSKEEIKNMYSPSKIFKQVNRKKQQQTTDLLASQLFKAWEFKQEGFGNQIETYTQDLFEQRIPQINTLKFPQTKTSSHRL